MVAKLNMKHGPNIRTEKQNTQGRAGQQREKEREAAEKERRGGEKRKDHTDSARIKAIEIKKKGAR